MDDEVTIKLFGRSAVMRQDEVLPFDALGGAKLRRILEVLALNVGEPVSKDRLADLVWEDHPPASYKAALESYVCVLRRKARLGSGRTSVIATTSQGYLLDGERAAVDSHQFLSLATRARSQTSTEALATAQRALALKDGPLLAAEPYAEWAEQARECCRREESHLCMLAARSALVLGYADQSVQLARRAVELSPVSDEATQHLMRALWLSGRRADALRAYLDLRAGTLDELGEEPGRDTHELYLAILRQDGGADATDSRQDLRILLELLRQTLDVTPGARAPALDAELAASAMAALNRTPRMPSVPARPLARSGG